MRLILLLGLVFLFNSVYSQNFNYSKNIDALRKIKDDLRNQRKDKELRISKYLKQNPSFNKKWETELNSYSLINVSNGFPEYYTTLNNTSAESMGVLELRSGGSLNMDLSGELIPMAIWDRGLPLASHVEFEGRLLGNDAASEFSFHSTHVSGTLLAGGLLPSAKGMCFKGEARAYDWFQDTEEIVEEILEEDLMISNHSYSLLGGWQNGVWYGNAAISNKEDYRFGFYSLDARTMDEIHFNAPYYTLVCAAGNDRGDSGDGSIPSDGPFDIIIGFANAKNAITVGAVRKFNDGKYDGPEDVIMSSFSSWGPTDDGRIKPDLVAPGVDLLSCSNATNMEYGFSSGTSMASPSAAGALALISEAYFTLNGQYMRSSSLKALAIHTAHEAGENAGPDYEFGWGMIAADEAVKFLSRLDGTNAILFEGVLSQGEIFELELNPKANKSIKATIVWTDPAPAIDDLPEASLDPTDIMLVNDLDMVISDGSGTNQLPWTLDPAFPFNPATRGNNFRDNVEQIDFISADARPYSLQVSHKGDLVNGQQNFSLILEYDSQDQGIRNLYWVNGDGEWSDGTKWSESSGGSAINSLPDASSKIIIDNSSVPFDGTLISIDNDFDIAGLVAFSNNGFIMDLQGNTLTISGSVVVASDKYTIRNGKIIFSNPDANKSHLVNLNETVFENIELLIDGSNASEWHVDNNAIDVKSFNCMGGSLLMYNCKLTADTIRLGSVVDLTECDFSPRSEFNFLNGLQFSQDESNSISVKDSESCFVNLLNIPNRFNLYANSSKLDLFAQNTINAFNIIDSEVHFITDTDLRYFEIVGKNSISITDSFEVSCEELNISSDQDKRVRIYCQDNTGQAAFGLSLRDKYCFDHLDIENVDLKGPASVSVGTNSTVVNSSNWIQGACEDLLFADFSAEYLCSEGMGLFTDLSQGNVVSRKWYVNGSDAWGDESMEYYFGNAGVYEIEILIFAPNGTMNSYIQEFIVEESDLEDNRIIQNTTQLASLNLCESYQWYNYGVRIPGETNRVYLYNGEPGIYFVVCIEGDCNIRSEILDLGTSVHDLDEEQDDLIRFLFNPVKDELVFELFQVVESCDVAIYNSMGSRILYKNYEHLSGLVTIDINDQASGSYYILINNDGQFYAKRIIKID